MIAKSVKAEYPKYGDKGASVVKIQRLLKKAGSEIHVNGWFSIGMTTAIKGFQRRNKLKVTGKLDAKTMKLLEEYKAPKKTKK